MGGNDFPLFQFTDPLPCFGQNNHVRRRSFHGKGGATSNELPLSMMKLSFPSFFKNRFFAQTKEIENQKLISFFLNFTLGFGGGQEN